MNKHDDPSLDTVGPLRRDWKTVFLLATVATIAFVVSESVTFGDAPVYAADIHANKLIEPGHLLWRPLGWLIAAALGTRSSVSAELWVLQFASLIAGVLSVIATYALLTRVCARRTATVLSLLLIFSNGFWAYSFSGCSYSASILFGTLALLYAIPVSGEKQHSRHPFRAGIYGGLAASAWGPQLLVAPAIWLLVALEAPSRDREAIIRSLKRTSKLASGYLIAFIAPLVAAYLTYAATTGQSPARFGSWASSSSHGIPVRFGLSQIARVFIGFPQSILSVSDLGQRLRLWHFHVSSFPISAWLIPLFAFYALSIVGIIILIGRSGELLARDRRIVLASACALALNLVFGVFWQGTDLERYFPSLPFQLVLVAITLKVSRATYRNSSQAVAGGILIAVVAMTNWAGTFHPVLSSDSFRQAWHRELRARLGPRDLIVVFGKRMSQVVFPHDQNMPSIDNVADDIVLYGHDWAQVSVHNICETTARGGRVYLADSLFHAGDALNTGWSFAEYPSPSAQEIAATFLPRRSSQVVFSVRGERVWFARGTDEECHSNSAESTPKALQSPSAPLSVASMIH